MMRTAALLAAVLALGCAKKKSPAAGSGGDGGPAGAGLDAAGPVVVDPDDLPEEDDVRAGKRTGLAAPDERPEVITEPFIEALLAGIVPWARVVDPGAGIVELAGAEVTRRCGAAADAALANLAQRAAAALANPALPYDVTCDNTGLAVTVPGVVSHAVCTIASPAPAGTDEDYDLVFLPDPARGLRLIGISRLTPDTATDAALDRFDEELGRYGAKCP